MNELRCHDDADYSIYGNQLSSQEIEIPTFTKRRIQMSDFTNSGERVEGTDGLTIFFRSLRPKEKPRAVVIVVPGFNAIVAITSGWPNNLLQKG